MPTRRYGDDEVREILALATQGSTSSSVARPDAGGLTIDELRQIAQEAGIDPVRVSQAAATLDARGTVEPARRMLGMPVGLSRVVDLPRAPTDREWEHLIAEFRTRFGGPGQLSGSGGMREWTHNEVQVCVEPTARGTQLRITATNNLAMALNGLGVVTGVMALLMYVTVTAAGKGEKALAMLAMFGGMSLVSFGANVLRLPRWKREGEAALEAVAEDAVRLLSNPEGV